MIYSFHKSDLEVGSPRVLPHPLVPIAIFMAAGTKLSGDTLDFLKQHDAHPRSDLNRWYIEVWNRSEMSVVAAQASFAWDQDRVICESIAVSELYQALNLNDYLHRLGNKLWCQRSYLD